MAEALKAGNPFALGKALGLSVPVAPNHIPAWQKICSTSSVQDMRLSASIRLSAPPRGIYWSVLVNGSVAGGAYIAPLAMCAMCNAGYQHSISMTPFASGAVQEPAALAIPGGTRPGSCWAFTDRTHAKQRHVCATREGTVVPPAGGREAAQTLHPPDVIARSGT